nr:hypothetical protein Iba_chr03bCG6950 [Ipomoea batatas]
MRFGGREVVHDEQATELSHISWLAILDAHVSASLAPRTHLLNNSVSSLYVTAMSYPLVQILGMTHPSCADIHQEMRRRGSTPYLEFKSHRQFSPPDTIETQQHLLNSSMGMQFPAATPWTRGSPTRRGMSGLVTSTPHGEGLDGESHQCCHKSGGVAITIYLDTMSAASDQCHHVTRLRSGKAEHHYSGLVSSSGWTGRSQILALRPNAPQQPPRAHCCPRPPPRTACDLECKLPSRTTTARLLKPASRNSEATHATAGPRRDRPAVACENINHAAAHLQQRTARTWAKALRSSRSARCCQRHEWGATPKGRRERLENQPEAPQNIVMFISSS